MPELTAAQIALGKGGKPATPGAVGRWSCCLCPAQGRGTLADAHLHYRTYHQHEKDR